MPNSETESTSDNWPSRTMHALHRYSQTHTHPACSKTINTLRTTCETECADLRSCKLISSKDQTYSWTSWEGFSRYIPVAIFLHTNRCISVEGSLKNLNVNRTFKGTYTWRGGRILCIKMKADKPLCSWSRAFNASPYRLLPPPSLWGFSTYSSGWAMAFPMMSWVAGSWRSSRLHNPVQQARLFGMSTRVITNL